MWWTGVSTVDQGNRAINLRNIRFQLNNLALSRMYENPDAFLVMNRAGHS
jgi:hypothetical protein